MDKSTSIILLAGLVLCAALFFIDIYLGGIALIILGVLALSFFIMEDSRCLPDVGVFLREDAKGIVVINRGNDTAYNVHVSLVPLDLEFDLATLAADARHEYPLATMLNEAKAIVTYRNGKGQEKSRTFRLSALGKSDEDLLKPMVPIFGWK